MAGSLVLRTNRSDVRPNRPRHIKPSREPFDHPSRRWPIISDGGRGQAVFADQRTRRDLALVSGI